MMQLTLGPNTMDDYSPLQKQIQSTWDDLAYRDSLNAMLNT